jgi:hypothetical protein
MSSNIILKPKHKYFTLYMQIGRGSGTIIKLRVDRKRNRSGDYIDFAGRFF